MVFLVITAFTGGYRDVGDGHRVGNNHLNSDDNG